MIFSKKTYSVSKYFHTIKYLKWKQIFFRIYYSVERKWNNIIGKKYRKISSQAIVKKPIHFTKYTTSSDSADLDHLVFNLINKLHKFETINWNFSGNERLWIYHLNYFDWIFNTSSSTELILNVINQYHDQIQLNSVGHEPYPLSRRIMSLIQWLAHNKLTWDEIDLHLFTQTKWLAKHTEKHLLGNHILENGFALLYASIYFQNDEFYKQANELLTVQLGEQILDDGAHFELSPMYHTHVLERVLDSIQLLRNNSTFEKQETLKFQLEQIAANMLSWLNKMQFRSGSIPQVNDCVSINEYKLKEIFSYTKLLSLETRNNALHNSGYRMFRKNKFELLVDVGPIGPKYIPGHAHADSLQFLLEIAGKTVVTDTGIHNYSESQSRIYERSTMAHNTISIENTSSSDIWASFRVGNRAHTEILEESDEHICARHHGYRSRYGVFHAREIQCLSDGISIRDQLIGRKNKLAQANFHFDRILEMSEIQGHGIFTREFSFQFENAILVNHEYSLKGVDFNRTRKISKVVVDFRNYLETTISVHPSSKKD